MNSMKFKVKFERASTRYLENFVNKVMDAFPFRFLWGGVAVSETRVIKLKLVNLDYYDLMLLQRMAQEYFGMIYDIKFRSEAMNGALLVKIYLFRRE